MNLQKVQPLKLKEIFRYITSEFGAFLEPIWNISGKTVRLESDQPDLGGVLAKVKFISKGRFNLLGTWPVSSLELKSRVSRFARLKIDRGMEPKMKLRERLRTLS